MPASHPMRRGNIPDFPIVENAPGLTNPRHAGGWSGRAWLIQPTSDYGASVPDLPGCISAGTTFAEALEMIKDAIELHLERMLEDGHELPTPTTAIDVLRRDPDYSDAIWAVMQVHLSWRAPALA